MTPELSHEDLSRVGCQHSWQEKQWFSPPGCHRSSAPGSLPNTPHQLEKQPSAELPKPTKIPQELLFFIQSDPALWISSRTCSARQSVTRAETHRGLAPNFSLQTLLLWAPPGVPNHLSLQPWSVSLDSNTHFQAHCSEGDPSLVPMGCTRTALRGDVPWD